MRRRSLPAAAALPVSSCARRVHPSLRNNRPATAVTSLFLDIGQGAGLAGASGVRPFLPPLLAGALARGDLGIDFDGTEWSFLESPAFLLAVFVLAVLWYGVERSGPNRLAERAVAVLGLVLGAMLFAGSLADGGHRGWPGIVAGVACAALAWLAVGGLLARARERLRRAGGEASGPLQLLSVYAELGALALAGVAIILPPVSFLALAAFAVLLVRSRGEDDRKYAGLRILR